MAADPTDTAPNGDQDRVTDSAATEGDAVIHPGAVIWLRACKTCTFYGPDSDAYLTCPDCEGRAWWRVEAVVQRVR